MIPHIQHKFGGILNNEKFVSNGMMMFTTKAGKAVAGPVERFGMAINIVEYIKKSSPARGIPTVNMW